MGRIRYSPTPNPHCCTNVTLIGFRLTVRQKRWFELPPSRNVVRQSPFFGLNNGNTTLEVSMRRIALAALVGSFNQFERNQ
jgi:hypothetical protein